jgi:integral membrane protein
MTQDGFTLGTGLLDVRQPPVAAEKLAATQGALRRYRVMAFVTGIVLLSGCVALILKYATNIKAEPWTGYLWVAHGYLYLLYVIVAGILGVRLRWPLARYVLVMLAGTIPTMSFVAEHYVTRQTKRAAEMSPTRR